MINSSWYKHFPISVDPLLKQKDLGLYQNILLFLKEKEFTNVDQENFSKSIFQPLKIVLSENHDSDSFVIKYKETNMSLFAEESSPEGIHLGNFSNTDDFRSLFKTYQKEIKKQIIKLETQFYKKSLKDLKENSKTKELAVESLTEDDINYLDEFETEVFKIIKIDGISSFLESFNKGREKRIELLEPDYIIDYKGLSFPFNLVNQLYFITFDKISPLVAVLAYSHIHNAIKRIEQKDSKALAFKEFDELFSKLDIPLAVFNMEQNLILHNNLFIKLNLSAKRCFNFKINEQVTIAGDVFKVQKIVDSEKGLVHLNFIPVNEVLGSSHSPSSEELGIVSSSIAHELNNPLAGVLAALNVLELDDYNDEIHEKFNQMKQSVNRCKKLVETFLGFSKVNNQDRGLTSYGKESFMQAMELMRFRLIESNITISFDYNQKEKLSYPVSSHVLSMIFYLFLGELLTSFSHQNLVELSNSKKLNLKVDENYDGIHLTFDKGILLTDNLLKSRLAGHLVEGERLELQSSPGLISLVYKDELGKL